MKQLQLGVCLAEILYTKLIEMEHVQIQPTSH